MNSNEGRSLLDAAEVRLPWRANVFGDGRGGVWQGPGGPPVFLSGDITQADADLIAWAVNNLPALLDAAEERGLVDWDEPGDRHS